MAPISTIFWPKRSRRPDLDFEKKFRAVLAVVVVVVVAVVVDVVAVGVGGVAEALKSAEASGLKAFRSHS